MYQALTPGPEGEGWPGMMLWSNFAPMYGEEVNVAWAWQVSAW